MGSELVIPGKWFDCSADKIISFLRVVHPGVTPQNIVDKIPKTKSLMPKQLRSQYLWDIISNGQNHFYQNDLFENHCDQNYLFQNHFSQYAVGT